jgi:hypothetical protein
MGLRSSSLIAVGVLGLVLATAAQKRVDGDSSKLSPVEPMARPSVDPENSEYLQPGADPENRLVTPFLKHLVYDQRRFWESPKKLESGSTLKTFVPFAAFMGALVAGDSWLSKQVPDSPSEIKRSKSISNYAVFSLIGTGGGAYVLGKFARNDHLSETGLLSGEAAINSTLVAPDVSLKEEVHSLPNMLRSPGRSPAL